MGGPPFVEVGADILHFRAACGGDQVTRLIENLRSPESYVIVRDCLRLVSESVSKHYEAVNLGEPLQPKYREYRCGQVYPLHVDSYGNGYPATQRQLTFVLGLNNDYEGGTVFFPRQLVDLRVGAGDILVFPAIYTHPHEVRQVTAGIRKIVTTWFC